MTGEIPPEVAELFVKFSADLRRTAAELMKIAAKIPKDSASLNREADVPLPFVDVELQRAGADAFRVLYSDISDFVKFAGTGRDEVLRLFSLRVMRYADLWDRLQEEAKRGKD